MEEYWKVLVGGFNYWSYIILMIIGLYAMIVKNNLIKKIIGMSIFQVSIILFFVSTGYKKGATIPIISHDLAHGHGTIHPEDFVNPLPHVLMLTAIVVGVATLGVALALSIKIYREYGTMEEDEILEQIRKK